MTWPVPGRRSGRPARARCPAAARSSSRPPGTMAWRRLLAGMSRPRDPNMARMRSSISGRPASSTPMTSAMTSRVMSSWVGPRPPHTMTASLRPSAMRSASAMRAQLSPTLVWKWESIPARASCSPIHDELVSTIWPSSSSVPTATISQRMSTVPSGWVGGAARSAGLHARGVRAAGRAVQAGLALHGGGRGPPGPQVLAAADHGHDDRRPTTGRCRPSVVRRGQRAASPRRRRPGSAAAS